MAAPVLAPADLAEFLADADLRLDAAGAPCTPLAFVDLDAGRDLPGPLVRQAARSAVLLVGYAAQPPRAELSGLLPALTCTVVRAATEDRTCVVADPDTARVALEQAVARSPRAAMTLAALLRLTARLPVRDGLVAESLAYSTLLSAAEFAAWRASRPVREVPPDATPAVLTRRDADVLTVTLNRPHRRNAFGRDVRDGLVEAFDLVERDPSIERVELLGAGESFSSGGDLDEFGSSNDLATAHLIRLDRSVAERIDRCRDRVHVTLHGACIGAGIELPSFAGRVSARDGAFFQLPELAMGLVPGAGGTVGITRRIGRWRTAYLALTGARIDVATALDWGLVDDRSRP